ncbi:MAG: hypothetical protein WBC70_14560 [Candidatus Aminicenantales bacterium]
MIKEKESDPRGTKRDYENWENSLDGIRYNMSIMGDCTTEDEMNNLLIVKVLQKLPKRIRKKVLEKVVFVHTVADGTVHPFLHRGGRDGAYIIFNFRGIKSKKRKLCTIAHEIGHFISQPKNLSKSAPSDEAERRADDLSEKWGFGRAYKDYKQFKGGLSL